MLQRSDFFDYQEDAYRFAMRKKRCAWWIDMGLGKTAPALTVAAELLRDFAVGKVLVVAPLYVAQNTWPDEIEEWAHLQGLTTSDCTGGVESALKGLARRADIYLINFENLDWLVNHYRTKWPFEMVIVDESSKLKTPSTKRFRALKRLVKRGLIEYMIQLTGTPAASGLLDVWAPSYLLDGGEALGATYTGYKRQYFEADYMGYKYTPRAGCVDRIYERLAERTLVIKGDNSEKPKYINLKTPLSEKAREQYVTMARDFIVELTGGGELMAVNSAVLGGKLQQLASGSVYLNHEDGTRETRFLHSDKLQVLESIVSENPGKPILVGYAFKHELEAIRKRFPKAVTLEDGKDVVKRWNKGEIEMLVGHPASMGHGLNLQHGGHIGVWYGLTWSLELYQQFNKRLARTGQKHQVFIYHIISEDTVDQRVLSILSAKDATQEEVTNAVMAYAEKLLEEVEV